MVQKSHAINSADVHIRNSLPQSVPANTSSAQHGSYQCSPDNHMSSPFTSAEFTAMERTGTSAVPTAPPGSYPLNRHMSISYPTTTARLVPQASGPSPNPRGTNTAREPPKQPKRSAVDERMRKTGSELYRSVLERVFLAPNVGLYRQFLLNYARCEAVAPHRRPERPSRRKKAQVVDDVTEYVDLVDKTTSIKRPSDPSPELHASLAIPTKRARTREALPPADRPAYPSEIAEQRVQPSDTVDHPEPAEAPLAGPDLEGLGPMVQYLRDAKQQEAKEAWEHEQRKIAEREAERQQAKVFELYDGTSGYPAECYMHLQLPGCEHRAHAICVGRPRHELARDRYRSLSLPSKDGRLLVYATCCENGGIGFKIAEAGSTPDEVLQGPTIDFGDIKLNADFSDMNEQKVVRWSRYLLAAVPGHNDTIPQWVT
ncbi:hypothetical protein F4808DRAFT_446208 [Astrocystis sublimbata]|nr:hypothetical protein F4808DRAFT_446207 [Astrocystis sublimbata]KAI0188540.1 hypothetical protein F4808DRAFT_446208 [Astrocystis sublimbata]